MVLQMASKWLPQIRRTIKNIHKANGPPNDNGKLVANINAPPRLFTDSLAASLAVTEEDGYSAPIPNPVTPRNIVNIQNIPLTVLPWEAAHIIVPNIKKHVAVTIDHFLPI